MTFYQELQLSSAGSKQLIHKTTNPQEKRRHILVYNLKFIWSWLFVWRWSLCSADFSEAKTAS